MGNSPAGRKLGDTDGVQAVRNKHMSLHVENRAGLVFHLASFEPPELQNVLPKTLGSSCTLDLELDRLTSGVHAVYASEVKIGLGGRGTEYDIIGKHQGKEQKVGGAFDLRDGKTGQFFTLFVSMPSGWIVSSSTPLIACSLTQTSDDLDTVKGVASPEGKLGCCTWHTSPLHGRKGCFAVEVRILKTDSQTMQGREALLASAEKRAAAVQGSLQHGTLLTSQVKPSAAICRNQGVNSDRVESTLPAVIAEAPRKSPVIADDCVCDGEVFQDAIDENEVAPQDSSTLKGRQSLKEHHSETMVSQRGEVSLTSSSTEARSVACDSAALTSSSSEARSVTNDTRKNMTVSKAQVSQSPPSVLASDVASTAPPDSGSKRTSLHESKPLDSNSCEPRDGYEIRKPNKSGAIALQAKAEMEQRRREEIARIEQKKREEEEERLFRANFGQIVATQDVEFQIGLLHDQLRDLRLERASLLDKVSEMGSALEATSQLHRNSKLRLERYGENPKIRAEAEKAEQEEAELQQTLVEAQDRLVFVEAAIAEKDELLALQAVSDDDM